MTTHQASPASSAGGHPTGSPGRERYRILVVDDDEDIRTLLEHTLTHAQEFDAEVALAEDARQGVAQLQKGTYDLVLSDQIMPEENGIAFLMEVKERWPQTLRMLITAHTNLGSVLRAVNLAQVHGYIEKPFDPLEVNRTIYEALARRQSRERAQVINVSSVQEALKLVEDFSSRLTGTSSGVVRVGLTLAFDSPVDFNRFTFELMQARGHSIGDVHVFEGRYHVTVLLQPPAS
jgi:CheY-like chemotaxis protein